jgi:hypothetical protein
MTGQVGLVVEADGRGDLGHGHIGTAHPDVVGEPYRDADGQEYLAMFGVPVLVLGGNAAAVRRAFERARNRDLAVAVYPVELFSTFNDRDNRAAVAARTTAELDLAGFAVVGDRRTVDKALDRLQLHP